MADATPALIDVQALIARHAPAEHAALADAYFAAVPDGDPVMRKPFFGIPDTAATLHGTAEVLRLLRLFPGARVLDFGAGTGWFSRMLAMLECRPVAVDVSARALGLGERLFKRDPACAGLSVEWRPYDGVTLPLADASVDRIVCYDSFHHVPDQAATLREFHRVLAPGGRVAFHEPGPRHSAIPVSQYEMRQHGVIENDIVVEDIWRHAEALGFTGLRLALPAPRAPAVTLEQYARIVRGEATLRDAAAALQAVVDGSDNLRIFAMAKGQDTLDSLSAEGLGGTLTVRLTDTAGDVLHGHARAVNTGRAAWRPSRPEAGGVWVGVKQPEAAQVDCGRIWLSDAPVLPGDEVSVTFTLRAPAARPTLLAFDLVSELVTWFETLGETSVFVMVE